MKIMPPDDPTAVYPIGAVGFDTDEEPVEEAEKATPPTMDGAKKLPPIELDLDADPIESASGGFNPLIAVAVVGVGAVLAALTIGFVGVILLLLQ